MPDPVKAGRWPLIRLVPQVDCDGGEVRVFLFGLLAFRLKPTTAVKLGRRLVAAGWQAADCEIVVEGRADGQ